VSSGLVLNVHVRTLFRSGTTVDVVRKEEGLALCMDMVDSGSDRMS
jgi:hypothetical protein